MTGDRRPKPVDTARHALRDDIAAVRARLDAAGRRRPGDAAAVRRPPPRRCAACARRLRSRLSRPTSFCSRPRSNWTRTWRRCAADCTSRTVAAGQASRWPAASSKGRTGARSCRRRRSATGGWSISIRAATARCRMRASSSASARCITCWGSSTWTTRFTPSSARSTPPAISGRCTATLRRASRSSSRRMPTAHSS